MKQLINISEYPVLPVLKILLQDKTTKQNIVFATSSYAHLGERYAENRHIDPDHTFIDPYMKSGLYPAEIVKRLYRSQRMKELFPDGHDRLKHIFEKQVFGLAPTDIIYHITLSFVLGFDENLGTIKHNFRLADALPYAKEGKLQELLDTLYGDEED